MTALEERDALVARLDDALKIAAVSVAIEDARSACNEVGLRSKQEALVFAEDVIALALASKRTVDTALSDARQEVANAIPEAEWLLGDRFKTEGNKTYFVNEDGQRRDTDRVMTADDKRAWIAREAAKQPDVATATVRLRLLEEKAAEARDAIEVARLAFAARKHLLDSAVAELGVLAIALHSPRGTK